MVEWNPCTCHWSGTSCGERYAEKTRSVRIAHALPGQSTVHFCWTLRAARIHGGNSATCEGGRYHNRGSIQGGCEVREKGSHREREGVGVYPPKTGALRSLRTDHSGVGGGQRTEVQ